MANTVHFDRNIRLLSSNSPSVSSQEVSKFSEMNETWWDPRKNPLVGMNPIRVQYIVHSLKELDCLQSPSSVDPPLLGLTALDVGCGGGLLSESLARLGATVTAIDPSIPLVQSAKQHSLKDPQTSSIQYRGGVTIEDLAASFHETQQYDVVCILDVIEHATNVDSMLRAASSLLKLDGVLFCSTINKTWKSHLVAILGAEYVMGYLPIGTHDWNTFQSPQQVNERMKRAGLKEVNVNGMVMTAPRFDGTWAWKLDPSDTDINWIGSYRHDT